MVTNPVDVVVVGAGLAGLTTARLLVAQGLRVHVLEARDRVGGRTLNHALPDGQVIEAGGQFVGPTQDRVLRLAAELGVDTFPSHDEGASVYVHRGSARRFTGDIPPDHLALPDIGVTMARIDALARRLPLHAPWEAEGAAALDAQTLHTWVRRATAGSGGVELLNVLLGSAFGGTAADVSALFALAYVAGAGNEDTPGTVGRMIGVAGGAQESRFVGGSQRLSELMAAQLDGALTPSAPVRAIEQSATEAVVVSDAGSRRARHVVVAVPPVLASRIEWRPLLPPQQDALFGRLAFGTLMKCEAVFERPFWREEGLSGQGVFRGQDGPVCSMFDNTPPSGSPGVLMGFVGGQQWRRWAPRPARERRGAVLRSFAQVAGRRAMEPVGFVEQDWTAEPWTRGGPTSVATPGVLTTLGRWRDVPFGRVHWAGAEHADHWNGYMDGAVRSGERAAAAVLSAES